ncbi:MULTISPECIES: hypothetical protein [Mycobacteriaceae]|uniref:Uncharacterized protein n=2 Tax=Mycolicibacterium TaxID=1866885 RepID=A0ABW9LJA6_9MYCO|nr:MULTISPECIES: hypothetical protein [Mycobacteriaceae]MBP2451778.1 hypothetical protein [Mycolicibacterium lutetiense]OLT97685.1 hypothetical protein BKG60_04765 [Mycobacterium syngnathidarum]
MSKFACPRDEVLYQLTLDGTGESFGDVTTWGLHYTGLGELTRQELNSQHSDLLAEAGASVSDFPENCYWMVAEDGQGFVSTYAYSDEAQYRSALDDAESRWSVFNDGAA